MTTIQKLGVAAGVAIVAAGFLIKPKPEAAPLTVAPPGWDYCTQPSYYTRACEASPLSLRWSGGPVGCSSQAICGNHAAKCEGEDGLTYPIISQPDAFGNFQRFPKPPDAAGLGAINSWEDCYIRHITGGPGNRQGCLHAVPLSGRLNYAVLTFSQLPPGPQKTAWGNLFHCTAGVTPSPSPTLTPTSGCTPREVTRVVTRVITVVVTATKTPHIGPAPTKVAMWGGEIPESEMTPFAYADPMYGTVMQFGVRGKVKP